MGWRDYEERLHSLNICSRVSRRMRWPYLIMYNSGEAWQDRFWENVSYNDGAEIKGTLWQGFKIFFSISIKNLWNSLSQRAVNADPLSMFNAKANFSEIEGWTECEVQPKFRLNMIILNGSKGLMVWDCYHFLMYNVFISSTPNFQGVLHL